mmetsp:Transcript_3349/g.4382  ORF Transcript_3349/g.4382 Transcript_3349/m.4382 type:complete len:790 (-) Transcript_3349:461-2830(-)
MWHQGMAYGHGLSPPLVHRDLKTPNILLKYNLFDAGVILPKKGPIAKIGDFGLAAHVFGSMRVVKQSGGAMDYLLCTWAAPEILSGHPYTTSSDVYSMGLILWALLARENPFEKELTSDFPIDLVRKTGEFVKNRGRPTIPPCPSSYSTLVSNCWDQDPSQRPSFREIHGRLCDIAKEVAPNLVVQPLTTFSLPISTNTSTNCSTSLTSSSAPSPQNLSLTPPASPFPLISSPVSPSPSAISSSAPPSSPPRGPPSSIFSLISHEPLASPSSSPFSALLSRSPSRSTFPPPAGSIQARGSTSPLASSFLSTPLSPTPSKLSPPILLKEISSQSPPQPLSSSSVLNPQSPQSLSMPSLSRSRPTQSASPPPKLSSSHIPFPSTPLSPPFSSSPSPIAPPFSSSSLSITSATPSPPSPPLLSTETFIPTKGAILAPVFNVHQPDLSLESSIICEFCGKRPFLPLLRKCQECKCPTCDRCLHESKICSFCHFQKEEKEKFQALSFHSMRPLCVCIMNESYIWIGYRNGLVSALSVDDSHFSSSSQSSSFFTSFSSVSHAMQVPTIHPAALTICPIEEAHSQSVNALAVQPHSGGKMWSASEDGSLCVWYPTPVSLTGLSVLSCACGWLEVSLSDSLFEMSDSRCQWVVLEEGILQGFDDRLFGAASWTVCVGCGDWCMPSCRSSNSLKGTSMVSPPQCAQRHLLSIRLSKECVIELRTTNGPIFLRPEQKDTRGHFLLSLSRMTRRLLYASLQSRLARSTQHRHLSLIGKYNVASAENLLPALFKSKQIILI